MTRKEDEGSVNFNKLGIILAVVVPIGAMLIGIGVTKGEIATNAEREIKNEESVKMLWQNNAANREIIVKHEAMLPTIDKRLDNLEAGQVKASDKLDELKTILLSLKK